MATVNLGRIKPVFRGAYSGSTAYVVDDIVTSGNETYICIQAHGAGTQAVSQAAYWTKLAAKGTDGTDVGTTITTQGDILYRDGSGLQRLAKPASNKFLQNTSGGVLSWETVASNYQYISTGSFSSSSAIDIDGSTKWGTGYDWHVLLLEWNVIGVTAQNIRVTQLTSGSPQSNNHSWGNLRMNTNNAGPHTAIGENENYMQISGDCFRGDNNADHAVIFNFSNMTKTTTDNHYLQMWGQSSQVNQDGDQRGHMTSFFGNTHSNHSINQSRTGIRILPHAGNMTGTYKIWGIKS